MSDRPNLRDLERAIRQSWGPDTSYYDDWEPYCPAYGQCAVTALVVQDYFGGAIRRTENIVPGTGGDTHYWNGLPNGQRFDLTEEQFERFVPGLIDSPTREEILSNTDTAERYNRLAERVKQELEP